jgi:hypothetical protein
MGQCFLKSGSTLKKVSTFWLGNASKAMAGLHHFAKHMHQFSWIVKSHSPHAVEQLQNQGTSQAWGSWFGGPCSC